MSERENPTQAPGPPQSLRELLEVFELTLDRGERIQMLIEIADRFKPVPPEVAREPFDETRRVPNCESEVFVWAEPRPASDQGAAALDFYFAVQNPQGISARAMAVILDEHLSGRPLAEVAAVPPDLPLLLFGQELSMGKNMGLTGMLRMVQLYARRAGKSGGIEPEE